MPNGKIRAWANKYQKHGMNPSARLFAAMTWSGCALAVSRDSFSVSGALKLPFVQEEMLALADGDLHLDEPLRDELAELLLRLLHSFLADPGPERSEDELRTLLYRWLIPIIEEKLAASDPLS